MPLKRLKHKLSLNHKFLNITAKTKPKNHDFWLWPFNEELGISDKRKNNLNLIISISRTLFKEKETGTQIKAFLYFVLKNARS